jgi:hypothetical protein
MPRCAALSPAGGGGRGLALTCRWLWRRAREVTQEDGAISYVHQFVDMAHVEIPGVGHTCPAAMGCAMISQRLTEISLPFD